MPKTKILKPSVFKTILCLLGSLCFVALTPLVIDKNAIAAWSGLILFGLGVIVFIIQLFPNTSYLKLTEEGFEVKSLFKSHFTKWSDVESFEVGYLGNNKAVMFNYSENHTKQKLGKQVASAMTGAEGGLPNTYGMKAKELAELMNEWKLNHSRWDTNSTNTS
jgi:hypothetical protein